jgi:hypothetical protein
VQTLPVRSVRRKSKSSNRPVESTAIVKPRIRTSRPMRVTARMRVCWNVPLSRKWLGVGTPRCSIDLASGPRIRKEQNVVCERTRPQEFCAGIMRIARGQGCQARGGLPRSPLAKGSTKMITTNRPTDSKSKNERGRDDWIRTSDLCVPNAALYQAEPRPDRRHLLTKKPGAVQFFPSGCPLRHPAIQTESSSWRPSCSSCTWC